MNIEYLPHTADIRMKIKGETPMQLFLAGLLGMSHILKENVCRETPEFRKKAEIKLSAPDLTCLLIDFLSEVLSISYTEKAIFCRMEDVVISENNLAATLFGTGISSLDEEIKGVTYHEAEVRKNSSNCWETLIVFDI
ncbi:MAG: archease [Eudoraea sp.]|nr:archease [Eudoraea sp.]NNJ41037.1 archease [Eudoraea sp.]